MSFESQVSAFTVKVEKKSEAACRGIAFEIGKRMVMRSPVDAGTLRNNWQASEGTAAQGEITGEDKAGTQTVIRIGSAVAGWSPKNGRSMWLVNNLVYGPVIEYGLYPNPPKKGKGKTIKGFSTQAPQGMVRLTVAEFDGIVKDTIGGLA